MIEDKQHFINISKKLQTYYCEYCKIRVKDGQVIALSENETKVIPIAVYASITMGPGTSVTAGFVKKEVNNLQSLGFMTDLVFYSFSPGGHPKTP